MSNEQYIYIYADDLKFFHIANHIIRAVIIIRRWSSGITKVKEGWHQVTVTIGNLSTKTNV